MLTETDLAKIIQGFAPAISTQSLCLARYEPEENARPYCCFYNVWSKCEKDGGDILFGWYFFYKVNPEHGAYVIATHHAIWCAPDYKLVDVTPFVEDSNQQPFTSGGNTLFLVDDLSKPVITDLSMAPLPSKYFALSDDKNLIDYVSRLTEEERISCQRIYNGQIDSAQIAAVVSIENSDDRRMEHGP